MHLAQLFLTAALLAAAAADTTNSATPSGSGHVTVVETRTVVKTVFLGHATTTSLGSGLNATSTVPVSTGNMTVRPTGGGGPGGRASGTGTKLSTAPLPTSTNSAVARGPLVEVLAVVVAGAVAAVLL